MLNNWAKVGKSLKLSAFATGFGLKTGKSGEKGQKRAYFAFFLLCLKGKRQPHPACVGIGGQYRHGWSLCGLVVCYHPPSLIPLVCVLFLLGLGLL